MKPLWFVSRQSYWGMDPEDQHAVEIAYGGVDYSGADMLCERWKELGEGKEFSDPARALAAARAVCAAWLAREPESGAHIEVGSTGGFTLPFSDHPTDEDLDAWVVKTVANLPRCDECGKIYDPDHGWRLWIDPDHVYCSEWCAEKASVAPYPEEDDDDEWDADEGASIAVEDLVDVEVTA